MFLAVRRGESMSLLKVTDLKTHFEVKRGSFGKATVKAVDGVSFELHEGEVLALVGESGCGKTTVGRSILNLITPKSGEVIFEGDSVLTAKGRDLMKLRRKMQIVFQDPYSSLNPRMTVGELIGEGLLIHGMAKSSISIKVAQIMDKVGLNANYMDRYPHEFSGGQRQRIGIARALILEPKFIVCDEAVSALDVSVQAQVLNLLVDLKKEYGLSYLFIAHNLSVVEHIADRVAVMYLGRIVELASRDEIFRSPRHPYTKALLSAIPQIGAGGSRKERMALKGDLPSPMNPPSGCHFHERCPYAVAECASRVPVLEETGGRWVACDEWERLG
jgi:oligopeptide/dipeptide ABC transporter ATP-binding protein